MISKDEVIRNCVGGVMGIIIVILFSFSAGFWRTEVDENSEYNANVTILDSETLKIESPIDAKAEIEVTMMDDGVISYVKKEMDVKRNEEIEVKVSDFETSKYKPTDEARFNEVISVKTIVKDKEDILRNLILTVICCAVFVVLFILNIIVAKYFWPKSY